MHINRSVLSQQQHRVQRYAASHIAFDYFNMLTSSDLLDALESSLPGNHCERLFPPTETLSMFLAQAMKPDRSCQGIVDDAAVKRLIHGLPPWGATKAKIVESRHYCGDQNSHQSVEESLSQALLRTAFAKADRWN